MRRGPYLLGLTGSIGMGKSTTAGLFATEGVPVWDADAAVHEIYARSGAGAAALAPLVPGAVSAGAVDREALRRAVLEDPALLAKVEAAVHPLVAAHRGAFVERYRDADIVLLDIPLLYETGAEARLDGVLVVSAPADTQRLRVLARPGMTEAALERILARQMPDAEKRRRADFLIATDNGIEAARRDVLSVLQKIGQERQDA